MNEKDSTFKENQNATIVQLNGNLYPKILRYAPDYAEAIEICQDFGYEASQGKYGGDYILVEYEWLEIEPKGDAGLIEDDVLLALYGSYDFYDVLDDAGYNVNGVTSGSYEIGFDELK